MNATNVISGDFTTTTVSSGTACGSVCGSCGTWYTGFHTCTPTISWYTYYPLSPTVEIDDVAELKAWLDGYLDGRKLTEKALKRIRQKLEDFSG